MSDIPIGTPPVPPGRHAAPAGWYPDPATSAQERYWDGWQWSRQTRPATAQRTAPQRTAPHPPTPRASIPPTSTSERPTSERPTTEDGVPLAGWGWRFLAAIIDLAIVYVLSMIAGWSVLQRIADQMMIALQPVIQAAREGRPAPPINPAALTSTSDQYLINALVFAVGLIYTGAFLKLRGATPGKWIAGIRVVPYGKGHPPEPPEGTGLSWRATITRSLLWVTPQVTACLWLFTLVDCLFPLSRPDRQAIHDMVARTQVIRTRG